MKVTVATLSDTVFTLDVSEDLEIENFKVNLKKTGSSKKGVGEEVFLIHMSPFPVRAFIYCAFLGIL